MAVEQARSASNQPGDAGLWAAMEHSAPSRRQWRAWADRHRVLASVGDMGGLRRELCHGPAERHDELLAAIVALAQHGPHAETALAVLVRCLSPGLRHRAGRRRGVLEIDEALSVMVLALVETVAGYDLDAHPCHVANRLLALATGRVRRAAAQARRHVPSGSGERLGDTTPVPGTVPEVDELSGATLVRLAVDAGTLTATEAWLIYATRLGGLPLADAARRLGLSYDAARMRRRRAELRWAAWWQSDHQDQAAMSGDGHHAGGAV